MRHYKGSVAALMRAVYPDHVWLPWCFSHVSRGYWDSESARKQFFDWAGLQLGLVSDSGQLNMDGWYRVQLRGTQNLPRVSLGHL